MVVVVVVVVAIAASASSTSCWDVLGNTCWALLLLLRLSRLALAAAHPLPATAALAPSITRASEVLAPSPAAAVAAMSSPKPLGAEDCRFTSLKELSPSAVAFGERADKDLGSDGSIV